MDNVNIQDLVYTTPKGTVVTDSVKVSKLFGKRHKNVLQTIRTMLVRIPDVCFYETTYADEQGKKRPMFVMNEKGFTLIINKALTPEQMVLREMMLNAFQGNITQAVVVSKNETRIQDVIHIDESENNRAVSARELHAFLQSKQEFSHWIKSRINKYGLVENHDYIVSVNFNADVSRHQTEYILSLDAAKELSMVEGNERGKQARLYFIEVEKRYRAMAPTTPAIPQSFAEALRLAACQAEQIEQQQKQIAEQKAQIQEQAPRVLFAQSVETAKDSILIRELAKILKQNGIDMGEIRLYQWLREHGYLCSHGQSHNSPTQKAMELGLFEIKKTTITKPNGEVFVSSTTKVTGKGQVYFVNKFLYNQSKDNKP